MDDARDQRRDGQEGQEEEGDAEDAPTSMAPELPREDQASIYRKEAADTGAEASAQSVREQEQKGEAAHKSTVGK